MSWEISLKYQNYGEWSQTRNKNLNSGNNAVCISYCGDNVQVQLHSSDRGIAKYIARPL